MMLIKHLLIPFPAIIVKNLLRKIPQPGNKPETSRLPEVSVLATSTIETCGWKWY